jgi:uncharacterized protein YjbI with pentapeptide repeats
VIFLKASLLGAHLEGADLSNADLSFANLSKTNLLFTKLVYANLSFANLEDANLSNANLAYSIIIGVKFVIQNNEKHYPRCENAKFDYGTIIDDENLVRHFRNNSNNSKSIPPAVKDKKELRKKLEGRGFNREKIDWYLSFSYLAYSSR